jgi:hypothetical protein
VVKSIETRVYYDRIYKEEEKFLEGNCRAVGV